MLLAQIRIKGNKKIKNLTSIQLYSNLETDLWKKVREVVFLLEKCIICGEFTAHRGRFGEPLCRNCGERIQVLDESVMAKLFEFLLAKINDPTIHTNPNWLFSK